MNPIRTFSIINLSKPLGLSKSPKKKILKNSPKNRIK